MLSLLAGGVLVIVGFSVSGGALPFFAGGAACVLCGALLWEVGSCALSLKNITKKIGAVPDTAQDARTGKTR